AEVDSWVNTILNQGVSEEQVIAGMVGSTEYFQNPAKGNNDITTWVNAAYLDILHRVADPGALATWVPIAQQQGIAFVATQLVNSQEFRLLITRNTYQSFQGRQPQAGDINFALNLLSQPTPPAGQPSNYQQLVVAVLAAPEAFARDGNTISAFVSPLYRGVRGRAVDSGGLTGWSNPILNSYASQRNSTAFAIAHSGEYFTRLINAQYNKLLNRQPSSTEVSGW